MNTIIVALLIVIGAYLFWYALRHFNFVRIGGSIWKASFFIEAKGKTRAKK